MLELTQDQLNDIKAIVYDFFAEECDVDADTLTDATNIITELEGDSLMLLSLLELFRKKYSLSVELKTIGRHLMKKPANTIGQVVELSSALVKYGNDIINVEL